MNKPIEHHPMGDLAGVAAEICKLLQADPRPNRIYVVTDSPTKLREITIRQWGRRVRQVMKRRAAAIGILAIIELSTQIALMQSVIFEAAPPADLLEADVLFAETPELARHPPMCDILIVTCRIGPETLNNLAQYMHEKGRVIIMAV